MPWVDLAEDVAAEFERLEGCFDCRCDHLGLRIFSSCKDDPVAAQLRAKAQRRRLAADPVALEAYNARRRELRALSRDTPVRAYRRAA